MNPRDFFAELKRRNVYKVAVAYGVVGWLVVQIATQVFPFFDIPNWAVRLVVLATIVGFPIALIIAWAFELTPSGLKRTESADDGPKASRPRGWLYVVLVGAFLSVALFFLGRFTVQTTPAVTADVSDKSIAVLPFDNLSHDPENAYFAEGVQDEILTRLAKIAELKVISRTSTQRFKSAPGDLRQIAQQLGVTNILEGSVQKSADQVRVNVQLINATTDAHLWADTYDRKLTDIFAVESEIAKAVVEILQAKLTGSAEHVLASRPTQNPEAHQLYLKGRYFWNKRTAANLRKAIEYFEQATEKDPNYALAYSGLADAHSLLPTYAATAPKDDIPQALAAARKAVALDETLSEAHTSLAYALYTNIEILASLPVFRRAIELNPNYATAHQWYGEALMSSGQTEQGLAESRRAQELDPLSVIINANFGAALGAAHRYADAVQQLRRTIEMDPTFYPAHWWLGYSLEDKGEIAEAIAEYERATQLDPDPAPLGSLGRAYALAGREDDARKVLDRLITLAQRGYVPLYPIAVLRLALGEKEEALRLLQQCYQQRQWDITGIKADSALNPLRGDPRFEKLVERVMSGKPE